jgi:hypothetical protein
MSSTVRLYGHELEMYVGTRGVSLRARIYQNILHRGGQLTEASLRRHPSTHTNELCGNHTRGDDPPSQHEGLIGGHGGFNVVVKAGTRE